MGGSCSSSESKDSKRLQLTIANSKLIRIKIFSPAPGYEIEIHELENVLALLEKFALLVGLNRSTARSLQLEFSENILAHELRLEPAALCDESLCRVLGADGSVLNVDLALKANAVDICAAAQQSQVAEVRLVCQYTPGKVNDKDSWGSPALHWAAIKNSLEMAELLLGAGASVDAKNKEHFTALHWTAKHNSLEVAQLLLGAGASIEAKNKDGRTALHEAARFTSLEVAELLLGAGASVNAKDNIAYTALEYSGSHCSKRRKMVALLSRQ